jgi:hypothetical protein
MLHIFQVPIYTQVPTSPEQKPDKMMAFPFRAVTMFCYNETEFTVYLQTGNVVLSGQAMVDAFTTHYEEWLNAVDGPASPNIVVSGGMPVPDQVANALRKMGR